MQLTQLEEATVKNWFQNKRQREKQRERKKNHYEDIQKMEKLAILILRSLRDPFYTNPPISSSLLGVVMAGA